MLFECSDKYIFLCKMAAQLSFTFALLKKES